MFHQGKYTTVKGTSRNMRRLGAVDDYPHPFSSPNFAQKGDLFSAAERLLVDRIRITQNKKGICENLKIFEIIEGNVSTTVIIRYG
mmetsp:Transcript_11047/g.27138  ORF Transcript_11047/g.27138 Transcript_11047/m.27138 type:complete len:86 (-) Transcript_11047:2707-2964(-)